MSLRTSANRYAKALFDVALEEKADLAQVDRDLEAVVAMMQASPDLAAASNRGLTDAARKSLIEAVAEGDGLTTPVTKLLVLLAQDRKLNYLPDLRGRVSRASARAPERRARRSDERRAAVAGKDQGARRQPLARSRARKLSCRSASIPNCSAGWSRRSAARCTTEA